MCKTPTTHNRREQGSVIITVMAMIMVFMALGLALFYLAQAQTGGTELERRNIMSFNVAEAGLDAGMLVLKGSWPTAAQTTAVTVDASALQTRFTSVTNTQGVAQISAQGRTDFITVKIYDNSKVASGDPTYVADTHKVDHYTVLEDGNIHPNWDKGGPSASTPDGIMVIDSRSDVNKDRKRIVIQAQRTTAALGLPFVAFAALSAIGNSNGGYSTGLDPGQTGPVPAPAIFQTMDPKKGVSSTDPINVPVTQVSNFNFNDYVDVQLMKDLSWIANAPGNLFTTNVDVAGNFLSDPSKSPGAVVFADFRGEGPVTVQIAGNTQVGSASKPTLLVLQGDTGQQLDFKGGGDFYGVVIVLGSSMNRGTSTFHGSILCQGTLTGKGGGSTDVLYNGDIIQRLNDGYVLNASLNVTLVPNTWVETPLPTP